MSLKMHYDYLMDIKNTPGTNDKIALLTERLKNEEFKKVIMFAYDDTKIYHINKLPKMKSIQNGLLNKPSNEELFNFLEKLSNQNGSTNSDKQELCRIASMDSETYDLVSRIVKKDLKGGFSGKTINKAFPGLIFLMPYCRCSSEKSKIDKINFSEGALCQEKADGIFLNIIIEKDNIVFRSRSGNKIHQMDHLIEFLNKTPVKYKNTVFMGELLINKDGKILDRKTGNGILNSCIQNADIQEMAKHAVIKIWDAVPIKDFWKGESTIPYQSRLARVTNFIKDMSNIQSNKLISKIETVKLFSLEEARTFYSRLRKEGKEGVIVKNKNALWKNYTSPAQVKLKNIEDYDLKIVAWKKGKPSTRFEKVMGAILCESSCGKLSVSVGTGFSDIDREMNWDNEIGNIVTISCESIIKGKTDKKHSLYLPRYIELRPDRNTAQTLKDMKER